MKTITLKTTSTFLVLFLVSNLLLLPTYSFAQFNVSGMSKKVEKTVEKKVTTPTKTDNNQSKSSGTTSSSSSGTTTKTEPAEKTKTTSTSSSSANDSKTSKSGSSNSSTQDPSAGKYIYDQWKAYSNLYESQETLSHTSRSNSTPIPVSGKKYYEIAAAFPREKVEQLLADKEQFKGGSVTTANWLRDGLADYENYITYSGILTHANKLAGLSYEYMKQKNETKAIEFAEDAQGYCKGVLVFSPNNQKAKDILVFADKAYSNATASMAKATSGALHTKNINKIVWSTKKYPTGPQSESDISTSFKSGETIYGTAYLSAKLIDRIRVGGTKLYLAIFMDDQKIHYYDPYIYVTEEMKQKSYVQFAMVPALTDDLSLETKDGNKTLKEFNETMAGKGPMSYKITVNFEFAKTDEKIEGSFDYDVSGGTEYNEKVVSKLSDVLAGDVKLPVAAMKNASLEAQMITLVNKYATKGEKYANCRIVSADWSVNKNNLGLILDRSVSVYFVATFPDGHCELFRKFFSQDYSGGGAYSTQLKMMDDAYSSKRMDCTNK